MRGETAPDRNHLAVRGRIVLAAPQIAATRNDAPTLHNHRAEWEIGAARLVDRDAHKALVLGYRGLRRAKRRGRGNADNPDRAGDDRSPADRDVGAVRADRPRLHRRDLLRHAAVRPAISSRANRRPRGPSPARGRAPSATASLRLTLSRIASTSTACG